MRTQVIICVVVLFGCLSTSISQSVNFAKVFADAEQQSKLMINEISKVKSANADRVSPRTLDSAGNLKLVSSRDWTSGFFPGLLWFLYEYTGSNHWKRQAEIFTANIEREKTNGGTHDMGFKVYCSFGTGFRLTNDPHYKEVIVQSA